MGTTFKVGDRVRCVEETRRWGLLYGNVYTVAAANESHVGLSELGEKVPEWYNQRFELATELCQRLGVDPKAAHGATKAPLALIPPVAAEACARALEHGAAKYGPFNWRDTTKGQAYSYMTYLHAMKRHIDALLDGEDVAADSGVHHLGHVMAGAAIVLDAAKVGTLCDDRPAVRS